MLPRSIPSCLLVVSHPDDDAIFAGELQSRMAAAWTVVVVTHSPDSDRGRELLSWQVSLGTDPGRVHFLGYRDEPSDWEQRCCSLDEAAVADDLKSLGLQPDLVVTHNHRAEYGHPHHRLVHRVTRRVFQEVPALLFAMGLGHVDLTVPCPGKRDVLRRYFPSQAEAIARVARPVESFAWDVGVAAAPALLRECGLNDPGVTGLERRGVDGSQ